MQQCLLLLNCNCKVLAFGTVLSCLPGCPHVSFHLVVPPAQSAQFWQHDCQHVLYLLHKEFSSVVRCKSCACQYKPSLSTREQALCSQEGWQDGCCCISSLKCSGFVVELLLSCRGGEARVLISTDVWARGLDVQQVRVCHLSGAVLCILDLPL